MRTKFVKIGLPNTVITVFLIKGNCLFLSGEQNFSSTSFADLLIQSIHEKFSYMLRKADNMEEGPMRNIDPCEKEDL